MLQIVVAELLLTDLIRFLRGGHDLMNEAGNQVIANLFKTVRSPNTKLFFLLQLGYFKVSHQFFVFSCQEISVDRNYLVARYFPQETLPEVLPSKNTRLSQQKMILRCQRYRGFGQAEHHFLSDKARHLSSAG